MNSIISENQVKNLLRDLEHDEKGDFNDRISEQIDDETKLKEMTPIEKIDIDNLLQALERDL